MRQLLMTVAATLALGSAAILADAKPAQASEQGNRVNAPLMALQNGDLNTSYAQYRYGRRGYYGRPYYGRPVYGPRYGYYGRPYYGRGYYRPNYGAAAAAGAIGLATGAIVGSAIANQQQAAPVYTNPNSAVAYCAQRFKSYNPATGTYLGYDGRRHACP